MVLWWTRQRCQFMAKYRHWKSGEQTARIWEGTAAKPQIQSENRTQLSGYTVSFPSETGKNSGFPTYNSITDIVAPEPEPTYTEPEIIMTEKPVLQMKEDFKEKRRSKQKKPHDRNVERYETISETGEGTGSQSADFQNQLNQNDNSNNMFSHSSAAHLKFSSLLILGQIMYFVALILWRTKMWLLEPACRWFGRSSSLNLSRHESVEINCLLFNPLRSSGCYKWKWLLKSAYL